MSTNQITCRNFSSVKGLPRRNDCNKLFLFQSERFPNFFFTDRVNPFYCCQEYRKGIITLQVSENKVAMAIICLNRAVIYPVSTASVSLTPKHGRSCWTLPRDGVIWKRVHHVLAPGRVENVIMGKRIGEDANKGR